MRAHLHAPLTLTIIALVGCGDDRAAQAKPAPAAPATAVPTAGHAAADKPTVAPAPTTKMAAAATPAAPAAPTEQVTAPAAEPAVPVEKPAAPTIAVTVAATAKATEPAPAPALPAGVDALIPHATGAFTIDGDGADWAAIRALPGPFSHKQAGSLKLAWRDDGLYGFAEVTDTAVDIDAHALWSGDCLELWIDPTGKRGPDMDDSHQVAIAPDPFAAAGDCMAVVSQGQLDANTVKRAWKARSGGYSLEFFIPAAELKPATLASGARLGFSYSIDDDGKAIEQFVHDKDTDDGYKTPSTWGLISLE